MKEKKSLCDGCKFRPVKSDVYPEICSSCCRWYADMYEKDEE